MLLLGLLGNSDTTEPVGHSAPGYSFVFLLMKQVAKLEVAVEEMKTRLATNEPISTSAVTMQDIESLQFEIEHLAQEIEKMKDKEKEMTKPTVAVTAGLSIDTKINGKLKFDNIITNIGDAYSARSGEFIAPVSGIYIFTVTSCSLPENWDWFRILQDGVEIGRVLSGQPSSYSDCNTGVATTYVRSGSAIWVERIGGTTHATQEARFGPSFTANLV